MMKADGLGGRVELVVAERVVRRYKEVWKRRICRSAIHS